MTEYGTIKIPREDFERHNDRRKELDVSWVDYLDARGDEWSLLEGVDVDTVAKRLASHVESTGGVSPDDVAREVSKQIDYAQLTNMVADEVEGRLR